MACNLFDITDKWLRYGEIFSRYRMEPVPYESNLDSILLDKASSLFFWGGEGVPPMINAPKSDGTIIYNN